MKAGVPRRRGNRVDTLTNPLIAIWTPPVRLRSIMDTKNRPKLADRVTKAAETAFAIDEYVAPVDVLMGIGWLDGNTEKRWRLGQIESLEHAIQTWRSDGRKFQACRAKR